MIRRLGISVRLTRLFVALLAIGGLALGTQRGMPLGQDLQGYGCCASWQWAAPSLGMLVLVITPEGADAKRWRRDFVLALEKRRAKRRARLAASTTSCNLSMSRLVSRHPLQNGCQKN
jgi:hypothetical protein